MKYHLKPAITGLVICLILGIASHAQPSDSKIAFASDREGRLNFEIFVMNSDGSNQANLTHNPAYDLHPSWAPDGTKLAFVSLRDGNREIYLMDTETLQPVNLTNHPAKDNWRVAWSPDGTKIAFTSNRDGWKREIYVMNTDGSPPVNLTNHPADDLFPSWSPDGTRIVFVSYRDGMGEIYVMDAGGQNPVNLTRHPLLLQLEGGA